MAPFFSGVSFDIVNPVLSNHFFRFCIWVAMGSNQRSVWPERSDLSVSERERKFERSDEQREERREELMFSRRPGADRTTKIVHYLIGVEVIIPKLLGCRGHGWCPIRDKRFISLRSMNLLPRRRLGPISFVWRLNR